MRRCLKLLLIHSVKPRATLPKITLQVVVIIANVTFLVCYSSLTLEAYKLAD